MVVAGQVRALRLRLRVPDQHRPRPRRRGRPVRRAAEWYQSSSLSVLQRRADCKASPGCRMIPRVKNREVDVRYSVLDSIYNAAVDQSYWKEAIDECAHYIGARSASMMSIDTVKPLMYDISMLSSHIRDRLTPEDLQRWATEYASHDREAYAYGMTVPIHKAYTDTDIWPNEDLRQREDVAFLLSRLKTLRKIGTRLTDNPRYVQMLAYQFDEHVESIPARYYGVVESLSPHVAKSLELGQIFRRLHRQYDAVLAALNHVGIGLVILQANGTVLTSNSEAQRIMDQSEHVKLVNQCEIRLISSQQNAVLQSHVLAASLASGGLTSAERIISLRSTSDDQPLILEISPLRDHLDELEPNQELVLLQLIDVASFEHCSVSTFAHAYDLTDAESSVAGFLIQGHSTGEIAEIRNTSTETVKSQVKSIMSKARVNSRIKLIREILKTDPPVN